MPRTLTRLELTAALAARQMLLSRGRMSPSAAIQRLTPLQGQDAPAPYVALAARLDGFTRQRLEAAITGRRVVKSTLMRATLHLADARDYPAYAQLARQPRLRAWRKRYPHLDEVAVRSDLGQWLLEPRSNDEIRERVASYDDVPEGTWEPVMFARTLLPLVQLPPAGFWRDRRRPRFVAWPVPLPDPVDAAALVMRRYLAAFGPAARADVAAWAGVPQCDFADALASLPLVRYQDERGRELLDLRRQPLPPGSTPIPVRLLARWDQALLAYEHRERILPSELLDLRLTLSGDQTVTVDGRVAASWKLERGRRSVRVVVTQHRWIARPKVAQIREEARCTAGFCEPGAGKVEVRFIGAS